MVIVPEMIRGSFLMSAIHAIGIPQLATGPQKCVLQILGQYKGCEIGSSHFNLPHKVLPKLGTLDFIEQLLTEVGHFNVVIKMRLCFIFD